MTAGRLKIWNADAGEWEYPPGGGSQPLKDLGTVTANDVATNGPQTLYEPGAGERIFGAQLGDLAFCDVDVAIAVGVLADLVAVQGDADVIKTVSLAYLDTDLYIASTVATGTLAAGTWPPDTPPVFVTGTLVAAWVTSTSRAIVNTAPGTWQGTHAYAEGAWLVDSNDHLQHCTTGGTSGGSEPVWATDGSVTSDGGAEWTDEGPVPTAGGFDLVVSTATPAAP